MKKGAFVSWPLIYRSPDEWGAISFSAMISLLALLALAAVS